MFACVVIITAVAQAEEQANPVDLDSLPPSILKDQLDSLPAAARAKAKNSLRKMNLRDLDLEHVRADKRGDIYYVCNHQPLEVTEEEALAEFAMEEPLFPLADTFKLHSRPGCAQILLLDFDGHRTRGTRWNENYNIRSIVSEPIDFDGNSKKFNDAERIWIQQIWQRVAEDFWPFEIDVTTDDPGKATMNQVGTQRVVISPTNWANTGGIAFVNSFQWVKAEQDTPAFCFVISSDRNTAGVCSHELGHTFGLYHAGTQSSAYYSGHGSGATAWVPIMGLMYNKPVCTWTKGEYFNGDNFPQDEVSRIGNTIATVGGTPFRPDDHFDVPELATVLSGDGTTLSGNGFIGQQTDEDVFAFYTAGGTVEFLVTPYNAGSASVNGANLDASLTLYDADGIVVASNDWLDQLFAATEEIAVSAGTYFLRIDGVGSGDPWVAPPTGYTDYGSLGRYGVGGTVVDPAGGVADNQAPSAPLNVSGTAPTSQVNLTWNASTDNVAVMGYDIHRDGEHIAWTPKTTFSDLGLSPATTYSYTVTAFDPAQNWSESTAVAVTTSAAP